MTAGFRRFDGARLILASHNAGKLKAMAALLAPFDVSVQSAADLGLPEPEETGTTFIENAALKAVAAVQATGLPALADDSGLEVDFLAGAPGIHSARYAGTGDDLDNNRKLVAELAGVPLERRTARFVCCLALVIDGQVRAETRGTIEGCIIDEPRGANGFGYDPHFWVPELKATTAELPPEHKNRISHRGNALHSIAPQIRGLLRDEGAASD